jgi:hypothetical protein
MHQGRTDTWVALQNAPRARLAQLAQDPQFLHELQRVGHVVRYLLDSNHPQHTPADRTIASTLGGARADGSSPDLLATLTLPC